MPSALQKIMLLQPKVYQFKKQNNLEGLNLRDGEQFGLIAQEVEAVLPEVVGKAHYVKLKEESISPNDPGNASVAKATHLVASSEQQEIKTLDYMALVPVLIKAMQEQQEQLNEQLKIIEKQQKEIEALRNAIEKR